MSQLPMAPHDEKVRFAAPWAAALAPHIPVCSRHGQPASSRTRVKLESSPPPWSYILLPFGVIIFLIVVTAIAQRLRVDNWPLCRDCRSMRRRRLALGWLGIVGIVAVCFGGISILPNTDSATAGTVLLVTITAVFVAMVVAFWSAEYPRIARASLSRDGAWVILDRPSPSFRQAVEGLVASNRT